MGTKKTDDRYQEIGVEYEKESPEAKAASPIAMLNELAHRAALAVAAGDQVPAVAAGTFALYVTPERTLLLVSSVDDPDSPLAGERTVEIPAGILRSVAAFGSGGGKLGALKAMFGGG
jgi:hypothetical protein